MKTILLAVITGCLIASNAWAEHEVDHRYIIRGFVLDENQRGIGNLNVEVLRDGSLLGSSNQRSSGLAWTGPWPAMLKAVQMSSSALRFSQPSRLARRTA